MRRFGKTGYFQTVAVSSRAHCRAARDYMNRSGQSKPMIAPSAR